MTILRSGKYALTILAIFIFTTALSQQPKRICVLGSSSAYGYFGNPELYPKDSGWVYRLKTYYKNNNIIDTLYNLAVSGTDPYSAMPTGFVPPPGRATPDPLKNITRAITMSPKPDVIIINFPTNHYDYQTIPEIMNCLQTIRDIAIANNVLCYVTTTQPRDNFSPAERQKLLLLKGIIESTFGPWAIDFWSGIAVDSNLKIRPEIALGDQVHLNPAGHAVLFNRVIQKNIFLSPVAVKVGNVTVAKDYGQVRIKWQVFEQTGTETYTIEKSFNGSDFEPDREITSTAIRSMTYSELLYDPKKCGYFRIRINDPSGRRYSSVAILKQKPTEGYITNISGTIKITPAFKDAGESQIEIFSSSGKKLIHKYVFIGWGEFAVIDVATLARGIYILKISNRGETQTYRFMQQ